MENMASHFTGAGGAIVLAMIAFSVVFIVLMALSFMIVANRFVAERLEGLKKPPQEKTPKVQKSTPKVVAPTPPAASTSPVQAVAVEEDDQVAAVISAVIAATLGGGATVLGFAPSAPARRSRRVGALWRSSSKTNAMEGWE